MNWRMSKYECILTLYKKYTQLFLKLQMKTDMTGFVYVVNLFEGTKKYHLHIFTQHLLNVPCFLCPSLAVAVRKQ